MALRIVQAQVDRLEREIDAMNAELEPLTQLHPARRRRRSRALHLARTIARRAERSVVTAAREVRAQSAGRASISTACPIFCSCSAGCSPRTPGGDVLWQPGATR